MSNRPIFVATHPRACSTAFERVFMTQRDTLKCVHEPFGDAFYFGPERLGTRYENDEKARTESGFSNSTYKSIFEDIMEENAEGKRIFIKDITHYLVPPSGAAASIAPSLHAPRRGVGTSNDHTNGNELKKVASLDQDAVAITNGDVSSYPYPTSYEPGNPTVIPRKILEQFHFVFLIRHPKYSIPSYWRCTVPPLDEVTGFFDFMPAEAGYDEQRRVFDYLKNVGQIGPKIAGQKTNGHTNGRTNGNTNGSDRSVEICVIDADDLLDNPEGIISKFCESVGIEYNPSMLIWDNEEDHKYAKNAFEKWRGFHEDAINSTELKAREHKKKQLSEEEEYAGWVKKYGEDAAKVIKKTVEDNLADYEYMKQFAVKV